MGTKSFYSDYVRHCLRFYVKYPFPKFHNQTDKSNWHACESVFKEVNDDERKLLFEIYSNPDTVGDSIYSISKHRHIEQDSLWKLVREIERKVAKRRGLL